MIIMMVNQLMHYFFSIIIYVFLGLNLTVQNK